MRTPGTRDCGGCRYWSEMVARAGGASDNRNGDLEALCLAPSGPHKMKYTTQETTCDSFAKNTIGAVDDPPKYGDRTRAEYAKQAAMRYPNGAPVYSADGTMLDDKGNRSIFDDIDE